MFEAHIPLVLPLLQYESHSLKVLMVAYTLVAARVWTLCYVRETTCQLALAHSKTHKCCMDVMDRNGQRKEKEEVEEDDKRMSNCHFTHLSSAALCLHACVQNTGVSSPYSRACDTCSSLTFKAQ